MMKLLILTLAVAVATAFQPTSRLQRPSFVLRAQKIDEEKIKDAASHFGKYSVKEIQEIKDELHKERVQNMMFDHTNTINAEKAAEQRLWEQELDLQLALLKKEDTHNVNLFPEVEDSMKELPHLKDGTLTDEIKKQEKLFFLEENFLEENVLETIAFCGILAVLMMAPQLI